MHGETRVGTERIREAVSPRAGRPAAPGDRQAARSISRRLASHLGTHRYEMWFGRARLEVHGRRVEVATDSAYVAKWIDTHFTDDLRGIARETLGSEARIDVRVAPEMFGEPHAIPASAARKGGRCAAPAPAPPPHTDHPTHSTRATAGNAAPSGSPSTAAPAEAGSRDGGGGGGGGGGGDGGWNGSGRNGDPSGRDGSGRTPNRGPRRRPVLRSLDEFVVGRSNRLAFSTACRLIEEEGGTAVSPLFVHGECGLGKTHLLQGICRRYADVTGRPELVRYATGEQFTNEYIASVRARTIDTFRQRIRKLDLLAIDDVHFLSNKVRTQSEFLQTLNEIDLTGARIVLASDEHPRLIRKFSQALISRFLSGMVVRIDRPDRETRIALVRRLAEARCLPMSDPAIEAVASRCLGSIRELEGAVTKLAAMRSLAAQLAGSRTPESGSGNGRPGAFPGGSAGPHEDAVGLVLVEQLFRDRAWNPPVPVRIATIVEVVCDRLGVNRADLMSSSRHRRVVLGRAMVAYLGREMTTHSFPEIARALGRSYHSTIHTADQRLRRQIEKRETAELGEAEGTIALRELADQLRHAVLRVTSRLA